ncbi:hypothetical protein L1887_55805 [Cichorium endivia]|nr:hypothetical protein L1887_55805 [Cichorium endivia]
MGTNEILRVPGNLENVRGLQEGAPPRARSSRLHAAWPSPGSEGYRVNAVAPGRVYTPLQPASRSEDNMEGWGIGGVPLHGPTGQPAEMGATYVYLADAGASNIMTGQVLHLSHGSWFGSKPWRYQCHAREMATFVSSAKVGTNKMARVTGGGLRACRVKVSDPGLLSCEIPMAVLWI